MGANTMPQIYVTGINRATNTESLRNHFATVGSIQRLDFSESPRSGCCWVTYETVEIVDRAIRELHHSCLNGTVITVRHEGTKKITFEGVHNKIPASTSVPRSIKIGTDGRKSAFRRDLSVSYTGKGILVDGTEYPSPQGTYLMKLLKLSSSSTIGDRQPLIDAMIDARHGNKHSKELSESMAMVNAIYKLNDLVSILSTVHSRVRVYVLADGVMPLTSIIMCLFFPMWTYTSIDPILDYDTSVLGVYASRIICVKSMSQDFDLTLHPTGDALCADAAICVSRISDGEGAASCVPKVSQTESPSVRHLKEKTLHIVIACHSHAPLQEFWNRVPGPKACVSMPCCGKTWSNLEDKPLDVYEDYEVFSPKRRIHLYWNDGG